MVCCLTPAVQRIIEQAMEEDDETTATQLQVRLASYGVYISLTTILRNRRLLGWVYRCSVYCQLICSVNKGKGLSGHVTTYMIHLMMRFGQTKLESTYVKAQCHFCYRKEGCKPKPKPRPKHPIKVHV